MQKFIKKDQFEQIKKFPLAKALSKSPPMNSPRRRIFQLEKKNFQKRSSLENKTHIPIKTEQNTYYNSNNNNNNNIFRNTVAVATNNEVSCYEIEEQVQNIKDLNFENSNNNNNINLQINDREDQGHQNRQKLIKYLNAKTHNILSKQLSPQMATQTEKNEDKLMTKSSFVPKKQKQQKKEQNTKKFQQLEQVLNITSLNLQSNSNMLQSQQLGGIQMAVSQRKPPFIVQQSPLYQPQMQTQLSSHQTSIQMTVSQRKPVLGQPQQLQFQNRKSEKEKDADTNYLILQDLMFINQYSSSSAYQNNNNNNNNNNNTINSNNNIKQNQTTIPQISISPITSLNNINNSPTNNSINTNNNNNNSSSMQNKIQLLQQQQQQGKFQRESITINTNKALMDNFQVNEQQQQYQQQQYQQSPIINVQRIYSTNLNFRNSKSQSPNSKLIKTQGNFQQQNQQQQGNQKEVFSPTLKNFGSNLMNNQSNSTQIISNQHQLSQQSSTSSNNSFFQNSLHRNSLQMLQQRQIRQIQFQQSKKMYLDFDVKQEEIQYSTLKKIHFKARKGLGIPQNMIIVLHFDGLLGIYDKPFFNQFNFVVDQAGKLTTSSDYQEGFNEKYLVLRRDLKRCLQNISKIYMIVVILQNSVEYLDIKKFLVAEKYAIDAIYTIEQVKQSSLILDYNQILQDFQIKSIKRFMIVDSLTFNPDETFYDVIPKVCTFFDDNPFGFIKYLQIKKDFHISFLNKFPKINIQKEFFRIIFLPSLFTKEIKIRNVESQIIEDIASEMIFEVQTKSYLQKNRTQYGVLNIEEVLAQINKNRIKKQYLQYLERIISSSKKEQEELNFILNQNNENNNNNNTNYFHQFVFPSEEEIKYKLTEKFIIQQNDNNNSNNNNIQCVIDDLVHRNYKIAKSLQKNKKFCKKAEFLHIFQLKFKSEQEQLQQKQLLQQQKQTADLEFAKKYNEQFIFCFEQFKPFLLQIVLFQI